MLPLLWNDLGVLKAETYPMLHGGGSLLRTGPRRTIHYWYTNGFLTAVPGYASSISYYGNMMVKKITLANGVTINEGLDSDGMQRPAQIKTSYASLNWDSGTYAYDGAGNIKKIGGLSFIYDKVSRLTSGQTGVNGVKKTQTAAYDAFGNITATYTSSWGSQTFSIDHGTNRLTGSSYDAAGRLKGWGGSSYTYNPLGQLQTVTGTGINDTYLYTAFGERIADRNALTNTTTISLRDLEGKLMRTYTETGTQGHGTMRWKEDEAWAGSTLLGTVSIAQGKRYVAVDHLGTPRLICDRCEVTTARHAYYPFGFEATDPSQDTEPTRFTGQETDRHGTTGQTGDLAYMHTRFYRPALARFLSPDVLAGNAHSPQSFNLFAYVRGNPTNYWDPFGMSDRRYATFHASITVVGTAPFGGTITVYGSSPLTFLDWMEFDPANPSWLRSGIPAEGGGIMERLAQQPEVHTGADVLEAMASFQCDTSWQRVFENMAVTNGFGLKGPGGFSLYGPRNAAVSIAGRAVGSSVPWEVGLPTAKEFFLGGGFRGMTLEGVSFTGAEAGVLTATGMAAEFVLTWPAWQAGVFVGSTINVAFTAPCHYGP